MATIQFAVGRIPVSGTPAQVVGARVGRTELRLFPLTPGAIYYGPTNAVTTAAGYPVNGVNSLMEAKLNVESAVWVVGAPGSSLAFLEIFSA